MNTIRSYRSKFSRMSGRLKTKSIDQFQTIKLSTITPSDINKMNLISGRYYGSQRISHVTPPIRVQTKLRDIYQFKGSNICVNDNSSYIYKRPSVCKVKIVQQETKITKNIEDIEKSVLKGFYERVSFNYFKDKKLKKSPRKHRNRLSLSQKLDQSYDPIIITKKPYHMKYQIKDQPTQQSYTKDLQQLRKKINLNSFYNENLIQQSKFKQIKLKIDEQKIINNQQIKFQRYKPELILPQISSSRHDYRPKKHKKGKLNSKIFLYDTPWACQDDHLMRHSFSEPKKHKF